MTAPKTYRLRHGLPELVAEWVDGLPKTKRSDRYRLRAKRFAKFADVSDEQERQLGKAWSAIIGNGSGGGDPPELVVFMQLPDKAEFNPHRMVFGDRRLDVQIIADARTRYAAYLRRLHAGRPVFAAKEDPRQRIKELLQDASATPRGASAARLLRPSIGELLHMPPSAASLDALRKVLEVADPSAKVPTDHAVAMGVPAGDILALGEFEQAAALKNFAILVADLNRFLVKPKHAALAMLARVNCPDAPITPDQIRMAMGRKLAAAQIFP